MGARQPSGGRSRALSSQVVLHLRIEMWGTRRTGESDKGRPPIALLAMYIERVKDHGETAHDQVPNAMGMEGGQKVFVVLVHPAQAPSP